MRDCSYKWHLEQRFLQACDFCEHDFTKNVDFSVVYPLSTNQLLIKINYDMHTCCRTMATILRLTYGHLASRRLRWPAARRHIISIPRWKSWCWRCRTIHPLWILPRMIRINIRPMGKHSEKWSLIVYKRILLRGKSADIFFISSSLKLTYEIVWISKVKRLLINL